MVEQIYPLVIAYAVLASFNGQRMSICGDNVEGEDASGWCMFAEHGWRSRENNCHFLSWGGNVFPPQIHRIYVLLSPRKLRWNLKMMVSDRNLLFQGGIFRCHISFREGISYYPRKKVLRSSLFLTVCFLRWEQKENVESISVQSWVNEQKKGIFLVSMTTLATWEGSWCWWLSFFNDFFWGIYYSLAFTVPFLYSWDSWGLGSNHPTDSPDLINQERFCQVSIRIKEPNKSP